MLLLAAAATYLMLSGLVILKRPPSGAFMVVFLGGSALGAALVGMALVFESGNSELSSLWLLLPALLIFGFAVRGGTTWARSSAHGASLLRVAAAALLGVAFPACVIVLVVGLAFTTGSTCIG